MNIILTGLRGTGKTSLGRLLARQLRRPFFDTDSLIEEQVGEPIQQYVTRQGWDAFREVEHRVIREIALQRDAVISTGGGALTYARNASVLRPTGVIVLLAADPALLARRLHRSYTRPPLTGKTSLEAEMSALWRQREPLYRSVCDVVFRVDAETIDERADFQEKVASLLTALQPFLHPKESGEPCGSRPSSPHPLDGGG